MAIHLTLSKDGLVNFYHGLPDHYHLPVINSATSYKAKTNLADIVLQEYTGDKFSFRYYLCKFLSKVKAQIKLPEKGLYCIFLLDGSLRTEMKNFRRSHLRKDQYLYFFAEPTDLLATIDKQTELRVLDFFFSPALIDEFIQEFANEPGFSTFYEKIRISTPLWASHSMKGITEEIIQSTYDEATSRLYFEIKVRELLFQILEKAFSNKATEKPFTPWEKARIHEARKILESHVSSKPPTIKALSKSVALNEYKLKTGFKQLFGSSLFDWILELKMQNAKRQLLETNKPIKSIAADVGYPRTTNFITAFRKRFGITPSSLRKR